MKTPAEMSVFALVTAAQDFAATLPGSDAELVRELCRRVVPMKVIRTRGRGERFVATIKPEVTA